MIAPDEALRRALKLAERSPQEFVTLDDSLGRFLATDVRAPWDLPAYDNSAMDGYAIRAADTLQASGRAPVRLNIVDRVMAGQQSNVPVGAGQAVRIMTGAALPAGADTVVRQEATVATNTTVDVRIASERGNNVRLRGETLHQDDLILRRGARISSQELGVLAAFGLSQVPVARRPLVHVVTCGDELHPVSEAADGLTIDSNGPMIAGMSRETGARVSRSGPLKDDAEPLRRHLVEASGDADLLITIGGASVGERDLVVDSLLAEGAKLIFHRVALKPGKPVGLLLLQGRPVFVLPGNPAACAMTFDRLVRPFLRSMLGAAPDQLSRPQLPATLTNEVPKQPALTYFLRGHAELSRAGLRVMVPARQASGQITAGLFGNALVTLPAGSGLIKAGQSVQVELLASPPIAPRPPVLAFAGYSGSGKTTALTALICRLRARGLRIAALKHDAHEFQLDREGKDTARFTAAGATAIAIASASRRAVIEETARPTTLNELIAAISVDVDLILVEGYKHSDVPKIVVQRQGIDSYPASGPNVVAVLTDTPDGLSLPTFAHEDESALEAFVVEFIKGRESYRP